MERTARTKAIVAAGLLAVFATLFAQSSFTEGPPQPAAPGLEAYTPSRLEWFAIEMQAYHGQPLTAGGVAVRYRAKPPDTIVLEIEHYPQDGIAEAIDSHALHLERAAQAKGYQWLKIEKAIRVKKLTQ